MSCNFAAEAHFHTAKNLIMKPLMLAKDELDCDHISESNYDEQRPHSLTFKTHSGGVNDDSDNDVPNVQNHHPLVHHLRSNMKLESALMEYNEGLNLINKPNSNINDDNNNTNSNYGSAGTSNDNNNNTTSSAKCDGVNKTNRKLFECDVCNVIYSFSLIYPVK